MGRIFDAVRPYLPEFCNLVDPSELMRELMTHLGNCDWVGVISSDTVTVTLLYCVILLVLKFKKKYL